MCREDAREPMGQMMREIPHPFGKESAWEDRSEGYIAYRLREWEASKKREREAAGSIISSQPSPTSPLSPNAPPLDEPAPASSTDPEAPPLGPPDAAEAKGGCVIN